MSLKSLIGIILLASFSFTVFGQTHTTKQTSDGIWYWEFLPSGYTTTKKYPCIVFLHGNGERGNTEADMYKVLKHGPPEHINKGDKMEFTVNGKTETFIIISPQLTTNYSGKWPASYTDKVIKYVLQNYNVDVDRFYLTGLSAGGFGVWDYVVSNYNVPNKFAAISVVSGVGSKACYFASLKIPDWSFHGEKDNTVSYGWAKNYIDQINSCTNPAPDPPVIFTHYPNVGHNAWDNAYKTDNSLHDPNMYQWFLMHRRGGQLLVNVGSDQTVNLPTNTITINSSITSTNPIQSYAWSKVSGPSATLSNVNTGTLTVTGMVQGTYTFRLLVTDNQGNTAFDEVIVTVLPEVVNQAPVANAGSDKTIALPTNLIVFNGNGTDTDGSVISYAWQKVSGPSATLQNSNTANLTALNLVEGVYVFGLTVTDDKGATGYDEVTLTVKAANVVPTVNAGLDQTIQLPTNTVTLKGSASDADGTIVSYSWTKQSGATATLTNASTATLTVSNLVAGTYIFRLSVTDNDGGSAYDEVRVIVNAANQAPVANAGNDQQIKLPVNSVTLNGTGSDADGTVASYNWKKVSGPSATLSNVNSAGLVVSNMVQGNYVFGLTVTDDQGATGYDEVLISVDPANILPVSNAGADKTIYLPTSSTTISGSGSDTDGNIVSYLWEKKSGPSAVLSNATTSQLSLSGLVEGSYTFRLTVTDNDGGKASDEVNVFVMAANIPPVANAGSDQNITLPTNQINISGSGSDADGSVVSYSWKKVSGPTVTITGSNSTVLQLTNLVQGTYVFGLTVTDNQGATGYDEVTLTVNPEPINKLPVVNAGSDKVITLPTNSLTLSGAANDPDGTIQSYFWEKMQGPSASINSPNNSSTLISGLVAGNYIFRLTATDDKGGSGYDEVAVSVKNQPVNNPPVVNAGSDIVIRSPKSTVSFNATATDDKGISKISWQQVSGPNTATISNTAVLNPSVSGLIVGTYLFRLTVTDSDGVSVSDDINVVVSPANVPPTVNAGLDQTIQLPTSNIALTATANDPDGSIVSYAWTRISGSQSVILTNANQKTVNVSNLIEGVYVFGVTVTDNEGATASDNIKITVQAQNKLPVANAGKDLQIRLPVNSAILQGSGSDSDGSITAYEWSKLSGPMVNMKNVNSATLTLNNLVEGTYTFRLTVTDNDGGSNFDDVNVVVLPELTNVPPVADAGKDRQITLPTNSIILSGSGSDADGSIASYLWVKLSGPAAVLSNASTSILTVKQMVAGTYTFRLTVTDNSGATASDDVVVIVNPENINQNPVANAGDDIVINLPVSSINLNGSGYDPDGMVVSYTWAKVSGPGVTMTNTTSSTLILNGLQEGVYSFKLTVVDNQGASASDMVIVTVNPENINQNPIANAGPNQSVSLPTNTVNLSGSGSDADGTVVSYLWQKISGPSSELVNDKNATLTVSGLLEGTYVFRLTVTDDKGATGSDEVRVVVVNSTVNLNPVVSAGQDIIVQLPTDVANLTAVASDPDGFIQSYQWTQLSGVPISMSNADQSVLTITNLTEGMYEFRVTVTDDDGATDFDDIKLKVQSQAVNQSPIADAGADIFISLPTNAVNIYGNGSDVDGTIIRYSWVKISGPTLTIQTDTTSVLSISNLVEGEYIFRLTVWDDKGGTGQDEVLVYVIPQDVNKAPVANAGEDVVLTLPDNSASIFGSGFDQDGEISSYLWTQTAGDSIELIDFQMPVLKVYNLNEGVYKFKLIVTDNDGAIGTDYMSVIVNATGTNQNPVVDLGSDRVENLPLDSLVIFANASDPDGTIVKFDWKLLSGSAKTQINRDSVLILKDLVPGTIIYRVVVTDDIGATAFDDIIITLNPVGTNRNPKAFAGEDIYIDLPRDTLTVVGQASDPDGDEISIEWNQLSGKSVNMTGTSSTRLYLSGLKEGNYLFELTVTDSKGASSSDRVAVFVNPIPSENIPPVADAGEDLTFTDPSQEAVQIGGGYDEDGLIISYEWNMVSGPMINNFSIKGDSLILKNMEVGKYVYELTVMDNDSAYATDSFILKILPGDFTDIGAHKIFSPDGNGIDDYWVIDNLEQVKGCKVNIFNRFGLKVFESNNYNNDWDGSYNGNPLPEADYYFIISCDDGKKTSGGIRIIRDY